MLTTLEHLCVRVVNCDIKPKSLEKNIFIVYELLGLFNVLLNVKNEKKIERISTYNITTLTYL